jgi:hypothetical protein
VLVIATVFLAGRVFDSGNDPVYPAVGAAIALSSLVAARRDAKVRRTVALGAFVIPASTLWLALVPLESADRVVRALLAIAWAASSVACTWRCPARARNAGFAAAALCGGAVCPIVFEERSLALTLSLSAYSAVAAVLMTRLQVPGISVGVAVWLAVATIVGYGDLADRAAYGYTPFLTWPSLGAFAYSLAWILAFWLLRPLVERRPGRRVTADDLVGIAAMIAVLSWGRQELVGAFSPDAAVLALIVYYALSGVSLVYVGRLWESLNVRLAGLALSIYASLKAILEASQLDTGFRVGGFLLSGLFLLAVAYWYQKSTATDAGTTGALIERHGR